MGGVCQLSGSPVVSSGLGFSAIRVIAGRARLLLELPLTYYLAILGPFHRSESTSIKYGLLETDRG
jgi:hypothetical protein